MFYVDKRILAGGLAMLAVGMAVFAMLNYTMPVGIPGMTEEETVDLLTAQQENRDVSTLAGILSGVGFLLILISFGARKPKAGSKKTEKKTATQS